MSAWQACLRRLRAVGYPGGAPGGQEPADQLVHRGAGGGVEGGRLVWVGGCRTGGCGADRAAGRKGDLGQRDRVDGRVEGAAQLRRRCVALRRGAAHRGGTARCPLIGDARVRTVAALGWCRHRGRCLVADRGRGRHGGGRAGCQPRRGGEGREGTRSLLAGQCGGNEAPCARQVLREGAGFRVEQTAQGAHGTEVTGCLRRPGRGRGSAGQRGHRDGWSPRRRRRRVALGRCGREALDRRDDVDVLGTPGLRPSRSGAGFGRLDGGAPGRARGVSLEGGGAVVVGQMVRRRPGARPRFRARRRRGAGAGGPGGEEPDTAALPAPDCKRMTAPRCMAARGTRAVVGAVSGRAADRS